MRTEARAVVIGGGVGGCSILYHLAKLGWSDAVLVEQYGLTHGSTWHSAGLVGQLRSTVSLTKMMQYSVGLYADLKNETGKDPGWHELGGLRLASSKPRMEELQRQAGWAKSFGLPVELISAAEAQELFPPMSTDGVLGAAFLPFLAGTLLWLLNSSRTPSEWRNGLLSNAMLVLAGLLFLVLCVKQIWDQPWSEFF